MQPQISFTIRVKAGSLDLTYDEMLSLLLDFRDLASAQAAQQGQAQGIANETSGENDLKRESLKKAQQSGGAQKQAA